VSALGHPHVLPVYEYGTTEELGYLVMPAVKGGSLRGRLRTGPLPPKATWRVLLQLGDALHRAHEVGVVHGDVKPGNVLFDVYGRVLLSDFGLARTHLGFARGTPGYMAPEQARGEEVDRRADVYALAVLAFEMLTGTRLFVAQGAAELLRATVQGPLPAAKDRYIDVPSGFDAALLRGLARSPNRRYGSTMELLWALAPVLEGRPRRRPTRPPAPRPRLEDAAFVPSVLPGEAGRGPGEDERLEEVEPSA
jgi:serine/threonine-protein kinase